jgi:acetolactate synthase I/III small subunit
LQHTLIALVQDRPGVLNRVVSLFRRRGFNIESLAVGHSETPGVSRMTLVVDAPDIEQVTKQLFRLIEVLKVNEVTADSTVEREMALLKVNAQRSSLGELVALTNVFGAKIADAGAGSVIIEMSGVTTQIDAFIEAVRPLGIKEIMRSGRIAMLRGPQTPLPGDVATYREGQLNRHSPAALLPSPGTAKPQLVEEKERTTDD